MAEVTYANAGHLIINLRRDISQCFIGFIAQYHSKLLYLKLQNVELCILTNDPEFVHVLTIAQRIPLLLLMSSIL